MADGNDGAVSLREHQSMKDDLQRQISALQLSDVELRAKLMHLPDAVDRLRNELGAKLDRVGQVQQHQPHSSVDTLMLLLDRLDKRAKGGSSAAQLVLIVCALAGMFAVAWTLRGLLH